MNAIIKVQMDNAAFDEGDSGLELARILRKLADDVVYTNFNYAYDRNVKLHDTNGNFVGTLKVIINS